MLFSFYLSWYHSHNLFYSSTFIVASIQHHSPHLRSKSMRISSIPRLLRFAIESSQNFPFNVTHTFKHNCNSNHLLPYGRTHHFLLCIHPPCVSQALKALTTQHFFSSSASDLLSNSYTSLPLKCWTHTYLCYHARALSKSLVQSSSCFFFHCPSSM